MDVGVALDGLWESLSQCLDPESARRVVDMQVAGHVRERIDQLAHEANEGTLSGSDQSEYEALINAADIISILKLKAQNLIQVHRS
jgi:hypothetical protein